MKKMPAASEAIFAAYVQDWQAAMGADLEAVILYGSAARGEYAADQSDINFLIVLTPAGMTRLRQAIPLTAKWQQRAMVTPLVLTRAFLQASRDSFPIELLSMQCHHRVLFGEDVLSRLEIAPAHLRLQLEREIKGKLVHLWKGLLGRGQDRQALLALLRASINDFYALFEAFLFLKGEAIPATRQESFLKVAALANLDTGFIAPLFRLQTGSARPYREELWQLTEDYIAQITKLTEYIDHM
ncbi:MAG: nucleotidyltransferase domain-containing protein [candidate division KSB1 bacterium]|nr:nucleotidyltransferase domain-containing protein [candidate division KSB1 bacterium]MDZ7273349.1 nucleotidyltransferase domain-containing protein [candidate division KSB1 bacterium]MDZ7288011.1 nucleotidyltransferase domain-containing protein [candidate division KSB1 bacterium]MDZ7300137.1 nucleotidyltransferase domain-containing protein [candidate division KSB1 bacterium]MDZ7308475.1 nucleotidyltransferase domain-containing protein [candidate division KSB1 bacterium]